MENKQLLPFERNRYYVGKMLTAADFQAEQTYFNNKRRFMNSLMYGDGILCGLSVFGLDDQSVLVESGVALDRMGREIVVENSVVRKLSSLEGFEQLTGNRAALCLKYGQKNAHAVYAIGKADLEQQEYNRISEGYELVLMDVQKADALFEVETEFLTEGVLLENEEYRVTLVMPAKVSRGGRAKLKVVAQRLTEEKCSLSYSAVFQVPAFLAEDGSHEVSVDFDRVMPEVFECVVNEFWLTVQNVDVQETNVVLKTGTAAARIDERYAEPVDTFSTKVILTDEEPRLLVAEAIGRVSLESRALESRETFVRLADIALVRTEGAYIIDTIQEQGIKRYIQTPADILLREKYMDYYRNTEREEYREEQQARSPEKSIHDAVQKRNGMEIASGTLEIPLGDHVRRGDIRYSGEIMHGLGSGNVYVEVGYENIREDRAEGANQKSTIYGNPALFQQGDEIFSGVETAIRVLNDKGSFIVAARMARDIDFLVLTYRWVAIKFPADDVLNDSMESGIKSIQAQTPTVVLGARESYYFGVQFNNMDTCSVAYELSENGSGEITSDGVYTAPAKEGVYEIRIYCTDNPIICTYAYAIVKKNRDNKDTKE